MALDFELGYPPNDMEINKVAVKLSVALKNDMMKWNDFGMNLLETTDSEKLTLIEQNCDGKEFKYKCKVLLEKWKAKTSDSKWEQVIAALRKTDDELKELATKLEKALKAKQQVGTSVDGERRLSSRQDSNQGLHAVDVAHTATVLKKTALLDVSRLKARYTRQQPTSQTDWPKHNVSDYVRLVLIEKEKVVRKDKSLHETVKLSQQGQVDKILTKKQPLDGLEDIFYDQNKHCPRLILITGGAGMGKTTLANEICLKWARDGFLAKDFDAVVLVPLRLAQQKPLKKVVEKLIGKDSYKKLKESAGTRCLIILEGLDEIAASHQQNDPFFINLMECNILEKATILITSRPHACSKLSVDRTIEIMGFGDKEITKFVENSFPNDKQLIKFAQHLKERHPHIYKLCSVPLSLVMVVDIVHFYNGSLPSTLTELYQKFIVMILQRQVYKNSKHKVTSSEVATETANEIEVTLCKLLEGVPKESVETVHLLSKLAYQSFFDCFNNSTEHQGGWKDSKVIFTIEDLVQCGLNVTEDFDGFGLLNATCIHELPKDTRTYNFVHLSVQECMCACYIATLPEQTQLCLFQNHWENYPNVFDFYSGLTGLSSTDVFDFVYSNLISNYDYGEGCSYPKGVLVSYDTLMMMSYVYESQHGPPHSALPFSLNISPTNFLPYGTLWLSYILSKFPINEVKLLDCSFEIEILAKHYQGNQLLHTLNFDCSDITANGMIHFMKIIKKTLLLKVLSINCCNIGGDEGISILAAGLQHNKTLTELRIGKCNFSAKGATCISKLLANNHTLEVLHIWDNIIGDKGIEAIALTLGNCGLVDLNVSNCGITFAGAKLLAEGLLTNNTIKTLNMEHNLITEEGVSIIMQSTVNCQTTFFDRPPSPLHMPDPEKMMAQFAFDSVKSSITVKENGQAMLEFISCDHEETTDDQCTED